jgi:hypothetical protein
MTGAHDETAAFRENPFHVKQTLAMDESGACKAVTKRLTWWQSRQDLSVEFVHDDKGRLIGT